MSDETKDQDDRVDGDEKRRVEDRIGKGELLDEVAVLTQRLGKAVEHAWDSDQRRSVQRRVVDELRTAGDQVEQMTRRAGSNKVGREFSDGAEKMGRQLGEGLLSGLKALNRELTRSLDQPDRDDRDDEEPRER